ncbi:uncharacterized protein METZ01_LOCUS457045, partial [marine metagenome]
PERRLRGSQRTGVSDPFGPSTHL